MRIRSRTCFFDRPQEVPLRFVRRWQELLDRHGALPLEEYVRTARRQVRIREGRGYASRYSQEEEPVGGGALPIHRPNSRPVAAPVRTGERPTAPQAAVTRHPVMQIVFHLHEGGEIRAGLAVTVAVPP